LKIDKNLAREKPNLSTTRSFLTRGHREEEEGVEGYSIEYPKINLQTISPAGGKVERIVPDPLVRNFEGIISYGLWDLRTGDRDRLLLVRKGRSDRPWSVLTHTHSTNVINE